MRFSYVWPSPKITDKNAKGYLRSLRACFRSRSEALKGQNIIARGERSVTPGNWQVGRRAL
jgi:hypothetical protein